MAGVHTSASKGPSIGLAQLDLLPMHAAVHGAESQRCLTDAGVALMLPLDGPLHFIGNFSDLFQKCPGQI